MVVLLFFLTYFRIAIPYYYKINLFSEKLLLFLMLFIVSYLWSQEVKDRHYLMGITRELQTAYTQLQQTQQKLIDIAKMQVVGRLASGVAHEVKNPLATILQGVDYLSNEIDLKKKNNARVIEHITSAVRSADNIVRGLLDFASISKLDIEKHEVNPIVENVLVLIKHALDKHHVKILFIFT